MHIQTIPFESTRSFSRLAIDYLAGKAVFNEFIQHPFSEAGVAAALAERQHFTATDRERLVKALKNQYGELADEQQLAGQIESLLSPDTYTVTTAHQPNLLTGPAYFIYKIAGTIALSKRLAAAHPGKKFIPVYWMGAEDHDLEELNHLHLFQQEIRWENGLKGPVGRMKLDTLVPVLEQVFGLLGDKPEALELRRLLENSFRSDYSWAQATRLFVHALFGKEGLVIVDGDDAILKAGFSAVVRAELLGQKAEGLVLEAGKKLEAAGYSAQIYPRPINLFWLEDGVRERIVSHDAGFQLVHGGKKWSREEFLALVETHPENFSPNVVLRPLYQEMCLPNVAFIGGGAEVAYWMLLKDVFKLHQVPMPVVMLRSSVQYIDRNSAGKMEKLGLSVEDIFQPTEELIYTFLSRHEKEVYDMEPELEKLRHWFDTLAAHIEMIDPSLKAATLAEGKKVEGQLKGLEARVRKSQKQRHETELNQIKQLKQKLFPDNHLQERHDSFMNFYLAEGDSFMAECCTELDPLRKCFMVLQSA